MKKRLLKTFSMLAVIIAAGIVYYFVPDGFKIKCPIHEITGFYCAGCGVTRMCTHLLQLEFYKAFRSNCGVFICLPFMAVFFAEREYGRIKNGVPAYNKHMKIMIWTMIAGLLIFGVLRNIPYFYFLRPRHF